jgi:hypothetical protein
MEFKLFKENPVPIDGYVIDQKLKTAVVEAFRYQNVRILDIDEVSEKSIFGTPIFMALSINELSYKNPQNTQRVTIPKMFIPCAIVEVSFQKEIIKTTVQAQRRRGTFKELINFGDYVVTIKGILSNDNGKYPIDKVQQLNDICNAPIAIEIEHTILNRLGIYNLVIESGSPVVANQGKQNIQPFTLSCVSDEQAMLQLKSEADAKKLNS